MQRMIAGDADLGLPLDMPVFEETVLLLAAPQELGNADAVISMGHCADFAFGKAGLKDYFRPWRGHTFILHGAYRQNIGKSRSP